MPASRRRAMPRRLRSVVCASAVAGAALAAAPGTAGAASAQFRHFPAPIGIVDATPNEQAAILARMTSTHSRVIGNYTYWIGFMGGVPVVDVAGGEDDPGAELAAYLLDTVFHPRATIMSGTAGAENSRINVGDVVLSGLVVNKEAIHYYDSGAQGEDNSMEIHTIPHGNIAGAVVQKYDNQFPTPADASTYAATKHPVDPHWARLEALAAPVQLTALGSRASGLLGTTSIADATGNPAATGSVANKTVVGAIGDAPVWTEPLSWIAAQNLLYQTDAEDNEAIGFAFANATTGTPWILVRGISDTPWYPNAYDNVLATVRAATVTQYIVTHLPARLSATPTTVADLSPIANARMAGYLIADQAAYKVTPVTAVTYTDGGGTTHTLTGSSLAALHHEYTPAAADLG